MQKTIVALYDGVNDAQQAVRDLVDSGINRDQISLMANNASGEFQNLNTDLKETSGAAEGAGVGAGIGAALGGIGGLLVGLGALVIPGIGPVLAAGPLAAAVGGVAGAGAGAITGGAAGGLIGAMTDMGVNSEQAGYYAEGIRRGGTLLTVRADDTLTSRAVDVMNRHNPIDVRQRAAEWREAGWSGFDPNAAPYDSNEVRGAGSDFGSSMRSPSSTMGGTPSSTGYGGGLADQDVPGSRAGGMGGDIGSDEGSGFDYRSQSGQNQPSGMRSSSTGYDTGMGQGAGYSSGMGATGSNLSSGMTGSRTFDTYESDFRSDYTNRFANRGFTYNQFQPAYRYGYDLASNERYQGRDWSSVEMDVQRDWESQHPDSAWEDFKDAIHYAYLQVANKFS
jgi:hypothetical protein